MDMVPTGLDRARKRTEEMDARILEAVRRAADATGDGGTSPRPNGDLFATDEVSIVATGSYGRRELTAKSDVDLLVVHSLRDREKIESITRSVLYPLWDDGLELGYAVRTVRQCLDAAKDDPVIATTLFDARLLAGSEDLLDDLASKLRKWRHRHERALVRSLLLSLPDRWARYGNAGTDLEPHVKEGRGALRDLQTLRWLGDEEDLTDALEVLIGVRDTLHLHVGRRQDRLNREAHDAVATALGLSGKDPRDTLLRTVYEACRPVGARLDWHATRTLRPVKRPNAPPGFEVGDGWLRRTSPAPPAAAPVEGIEAALTVPTIPPALDVLTWAGRATEPIRWDDETREAFLRVLRESPSAAWEFLDTSGLLYRYLPEIAHTRGKAQHNPLHEKCVDAHCWETVLMARQLATSDDLPLAKAVHADLDDPDLLLLAALLHDAGKGLPGDHSRQGVVLSRRVSKRMGYGANVEETLAFLVGHHLLLPDFATTRDLSDEELALGLAGKIRDPQRLRLLYLLAIADSKATGPAAWSAWKGQLLDELFVKLAHLVDPDDIVSRDMQNRVARKEAELARQMGGVDGAALLAAFPHRYRLSVPAPLMAVHLAMLDDLDRSADGELEDGAPVRMHADSDVLSVVAPDRPGLLSCVTGILAVHGITVHRAQIYTRTDGVAVDVLDVADAHDDQIRPAKWQRVERDLGAAIDLGLDVDSRLSERSARYDAPGLGGDVTVTLDNTASDWYSIVEVRGEDRVGLLHDIATVLSDIGCNVHHAQVDTAAGVARDSFSVRSAEGVRLEHSETIAAELQERISGRFHARRRGS